MRIRARQTGDVIELNDEGARTLIDAGIYDAAEPTQKDPPKEPPKEPPKKTDDMPSPTTKPKKGP